MSLLEGGHRGHSLCADPAKISGCCCSDKEGHGYGITLWEPMGKYFQILTLPKTFHLMAGVSFYLIKYVHNTRYLC